MALHPVDAFVCKMLVKMSECTDWGSSSATGWAGKHSITIADPGSIQVSIQLL